MCIVRLRSACQCITSHIHNVYKCAVLSPGRHPVPSYSSEEAGPSTQRDYDNNPIRHDALFSQAYLSLPQSHGGHHYWQQATPQQVTHPSIVGSPHKHGPQPPAPPATAPLIAGPSGLLQGGKLITSRTQEKYSYCNCL